MVKSPSYKYGQHFRTISVFATLALSAITSTSAAPILGAVDNTVAPVVGTVEGLLPVGDLLATRDVTTQSIAFIFNDVTVKLAHPIAELSYLKVANATQENVELFVGDVVTILSGAVVSLKALVGLELTVILAPLTGEVLLTVGDVACLVSNLLHLVLGVVAYLLTVVQINLYLHIFTPLAVILATLVGAVTGLVGGLLFALTPLVADLTGTILALGAPALITVFNLV